MGFRSTDGPMIRSPDLKGAFLSKTEARQRHSIGRLGDFDFHAGNIWRIHPSLAQHGILCKHFGVHLGDEVVLAAFILAPDLPEFDVLDGHNVSCDSDYSPANGESIPMGLLSSSVSFRFDTMSSSQGEPNDSRNHASPTEPQWKAGRCAGWQIHRT